MNRVFTQRELGQYLKDNPYGLEFNVGDKELMNGKDYIFLDYTGETLIPSDNKGCYKTNVQISIYCKEFAKRKKVVDYVRDIIQCSIQYQGSDEGNYFVAILTSELFING